MNVYSVVYIFAHFFINGLDTLRTVMGTQGTMQTICQLLFFSKKIKRKRTSTTACVRHDALLLLSKKSKVFVNKKSKKDTTKF